MITSASNSRIRNIQQLNTKGKARREQGLFVAEGLKMFQEAPREQIAEVYVSESFADEHGDSLRGLPWEMVEDRLFTSICDTKTPQGILCLLRRFSYKAEDILGGDSPCVLLLEDLQDPGNLGTIFRAGEGAGISGIWLSKGCVDVYNPKTIRSTMGSVYRVPFVYGESLEEAAGMLRERRIPLYAAHLKGTAFYDQEDYASGCAFLIGNEGNGLTPEAAALADRYIRIPMEGRLESLNAGVAASLLAYEAYRQRRHKKTLQDGRKLLE